MVWRPAGPPPPVEIHPEAIQEAQAFIEAHYRDAEKRAMEAWLRRFIVEVHKDPYKVLGYPPKKAASDPTLLKYPAQPKVPIAAEATVHLPDSTIHVYKILPRPPEALLKAREVEDAERVRQAGERSAPKPAFDRAERLKALRAAEAKKRRKS